MNVKTLMLVSASAACLTACSTSPSRPQVWEGASPQVREHLGTVGVRVNYAQSRAFVSDMPDAKKIAAGEGAAFGVAASLAATASIESAAPLALMLMPAFAAGGAIYGSIAGVSEAELRAGLTAVTNTLRDCDLAVHLPERIIEQARARDFDIVDARGHDAVCDTRLSVRIVTQQLARGALETPNPDLFLHYVVEAKLTDTNGTALYSTYVEMTSNRRSFSDWAEHDARRLRRESQRMAQQIAGKIVARVFLGTASK